MEASGDMEMGAPFNLVPEEITSVDLMQELIQNAFTVYALIWL